MFSFLQIQYIASQRFAPNNIAYSRIYAHHIRRFQRVAFFDESGINKQGMSNRRNDGWNYVGAGGAFLTMPLRNWTVSNITVMAFLDRSGVCCVDTHLGGTDTQYVNNYMLQAADQLSLRGVDCVVLDNCSAHKAWWIEYYMNRRGIAVVFLPRYWPEWNPIELVWNYLKDWLFPNLRRLNNVNNIGPTIRQGLARVTGDLARSFINKSVIYPNAWTTPQWNGPGPQ